MPHRVQWWELPKEMAKEKSYMLEYNVPKTQHAPKGSFR